MVAQRCVDTGREGFAQGVRDRLKAEKTVEIVGLYWHFVDVVWILIFTIVYLIT